MKPREALISLVCATLQQREQPERALIAVIDALEAINQADKEEASRIRMPEDGECLECTHYHGRGHGARATKPPEPEEREER